LCIGLTAQPYLYGLCQSRDCTGIRTFAALNADDFPVNADGKKIKKQDGTPIANNDDPAVAADVAERLNEDETRREEDKWSA
jgi:hypothetical protein